MQRFEIFMQDNYIIYSLKFTYLFTYLSIYVFIHNFASDAIEAPLNFICVENWSYTWNMKIYI